MIAARTPVTLTFQKAVPSLPLYCNTPATVRPHLQILKAQLLLCAVSSLVLFLPFLCSFFSIPQVKLKPDAFAAMESRISRHGFAHRYKQHLVSVIPIEPASKTAELQIGFEGKDLPSTLHFGLFDTAYMKGTYESNALQMFNYNIENLSIRRAQGFVAIIICFRFSLACYYRRHCAERWLLFREPCSH